MRRQSDPARAVAIIGMACRFPGAKDATSFWRLLLEGRDAVGQIPPDRMDVARLYDEAPAMPGRIMTRNGGYLQGLDRFDAAFFGISPREAERMDPQQRLVLETAWEALEDAGLDAASLSGRSVGVYVGQWLSDFEMRLLADPEIADFEMTTGSGRYTTAGRLSYFLGLEGPSLTLDTACSSSLTAVHLAVQGLRAGETELAFAAGVNVILSPHITVGYSQSRMMAPDGRCKFGDADGDGYVRSEGAGIVLLKRLDRALADGDRVHAVIRGSAINNDGRSGRSMGTPSRRGQEALLRRALDDAGIAAVRIGYVEAHGTGTRAGDPVELGALSAVLGAGREAPLRVGSVKTNIGHTESAAGLAGLMKATMAVHSGVIPPSLNCRSRNPEIDWQSIEIPSQTEDWPGPCRAAGVSGFGIAGSNAHVIVEQAPAGTVRQDPSPAAFRVPVLPLSAESDGALRTLAAQYADLVENQPELALRDICAAAAIRRTALPRRAAFAQAGREAMTTALRAFAEGGEATAGGYALPGAAPGVVFVAPGQGGQWTGMARALLADEPAFRAAIEECEAALAPLVDWSLVEQIELDEAAAGWRLGEIAVIQPTLAALAIAYARYWPAIGIDPAMCLGHSMGEVAAAAVAGILTVPQAMRVVVARSALMARTSGSGGMALVELAGDDLGRRLAPYSGRLSVAAVNSPRANVISGETEALDTLLAELEGEGVFCRRVKVDVASHGPQMAPLAPELAATLADLVPGSGELPFFSTVFGGRLDGRPLDGGYWARNLREPVRFLDAVEAAVADGGGAFVELGPNPVLLTSVEQILHRRSDAAALVATERRDRPAAEVVAQGLATLWAGGVQVDWRRYSGVPGAEVPLPLYPWQRARHWHEAADLRPGGAAGARPRAPEEAVRALLHEIQWDAAAPPPAAAAAGQSWLVVGDGDAGSLAAALEAAGAEVRDSRLNDVATGGPADGILALAPETGAGFLPIALLQAVQTWPAPPGRLVLVTRGAAATGDGAPVSQDHAALVGAARVVAEEHPEQAIRLIDVERAADLAAGLASAAAAIAAQALAPGAEPEAALRAGQWRVPRLRPAPEAGGPRKDFALRPDAAYLVTGGLSTLGLRAASVLADQGARRIVLLSRRELPPREDWRHAADGSEIGSRIAGVLALEQKGVAVELAAFDVADEAALRRFLAEREAEMRPPVRGVAHLATAYETRLATATDQAAFDRALAAKLEGARILDRALPDLDLFVLYSSTMTMMPHQGLAGYAAANCGLEALAADRRARGAPALSIAWCPWRSLGRAALDHVAADFERRGELSLAPEDGDALLGWLIGRDAAAVSAFRIDAASFRESGRGRARQLFAELLRDDVGLGAEVDSLAGMSDGDRHEAVERLVRNAAAKVLKLPAAELDIDRPLGTLGLNSLMGIELRNALEAALGRPLPATLAWSYPTVRALGVHLAAAPTLAAEAPEPWPEPAAEDTDLELETVAAMSDDEALAALLGHRR